MNPLATLLLVLCTVCVVTAAFVCLYHLSLMATAPFCQRKRRCCGGPVLHSFGIVIPAHNEEATIRLTLDSCAA